MEGNNRAAAFQAECHGGVVSSHTAALIDTSPMTCKDFCSVTFAVLVAQVSSEKWLLYNFNM